MGNSFASRRSGRSDIERGASSAGGDEDETRPLYMQVLQRVPPRLRERKAYAYDPSVVSLGPYHHGHPKFRQFEEFKDEFVTILLKTHDRRRLFRAKILERIQDIRHFYGGLSIDDHDDEALAEMMLRDACVVVLYLKMSAAKGEEEEEEDLMFLLRRLGMFQVTVMASDVFYKLENQIPWWLMKALICFTCDDKEEEGDELIRRFLSIQFFGNFTKLKHVSWDLIRDESYPLHLLEAIRNTILYNLENPDDNPEEEEKMFDIGRYVEEMTKEAESSTDVAASPCPALKCKWWSWRGSSRGGFLEPRKRPFRSVTELKAKGIYFKPSSHFLLDISFNSYYFFGVLHLPVFIVTQDSRVAFSNIMALEMSPGSACLDLAVASYLGLMKSMVESPSDVKALQEKGILLSYLQDNDEVVRFFKEMDSYGIEALPVFDEIKMRINDHCNSKAKTWIAELVDTNFRSPWTAIALVAATFLLCLTFIQTYYTLNPRSSIS